MVEVDTTGEPAMALDLSSVWGNRGHGSGAKLVLIKLEFRNEVNVVETLTTFL